MPATAAIPSLTPSCYSPAALLTAFGNSLASPLLNKIFTVKGIYRAGKGVNYNGLYYDNLQDELTDVSVILLSPQQLRTQLRDGEQIEASVYLSKRLQASTSRIEIQVMINELLFRQEKVVSQAENEALSLIQQKAKAGYKDADAFIRRKLFEQHPVDVTILIGQSAIIDQDIQHQLKDAVTAFQVRFVRINLALVTEIIRALKAYQDTDILVIARGGGENMHIFDNPELATFAITIKPIFLTALGHSADEPLLQKVADKALITPTALGQYFHDLYTKTIEDLNGSKAKLIGDLSKQIDLNYQQKIQGLQQQLSESIRTGKESLQNVERQSRALSDRLASSRRVNQILAIALCALFLFLIMYCGKHA
jgi:exodeoxyribonuclease VII large subunit